jgi:hypothetical protein
VSCSSTDILFHAICRQARLGELISAYTAEALRDRRCSDHGGTSDGPAPGGTPDGLAPEGPPHAVLDPSVISASGTNAGTSQKASKLAQKRSRSRAMRVLGKTFRLRDKDHQKFVLRHLGQRLFGSVVPKTPSIAKITPKRGRPFLHSDSQSESGRGSCNVRRSRDPCGAKCR